MIKMISGPRRLVPLISVMIVFSFAWWHLRSVPTTTWPSSSWRSAHAPSSSRPTSLRGDALDFGIPLRFSDGVAKPKGSKYTYEIIVPKTQKEDIAWLQREVPAESLVIYEVDNPDAVNKIPKNKGREAMVYLSYLIDHYDRLPDTAIFLHAHQYAWHNNMLMGLDTAQMLKRLNHDRVARMGYMNVRCHQNPGCPDWIHMDRPGGDFDFFHKPEEIYWRRHVWEELHPGAPIPPSLSGPCCAQFALSRQRIREVPVERFIHYRKWLLTTGIDDQFSGRIFEYIWHYIFTGHEVYCPAMNTCYCDGYGYCFGGRQNFEDYFTMQDERNAKFDKFDAFRKREDAAKKDGKEVSFNQTEKELYEELKLQIPPMDNKLEELRKEALKRGEDPKARKEETESWDSTRIWDYAPKHD